MCGFLVGAHGVLFGIFLTAFICGGAIVVAWSVNIISFPAGWIIALIFAGIGVIFLFLWVGETATTDSACNGPAAGTYTYNVSLGYEGESDTPKLERVVVSNNLVTFYVIFSNTTGSPETLDCPDPGSVNGVPAVTFGGSDSGEYATLVDYYCRTIPNTSITLNPGGTLTAWASFQGNWRFEQPFTFWWYGNTVEGMKLPG